MDVRSTNKGHLSVNWGEVMLVDSLWCFFYWVYWGHKLNRK